MIRKQGKPKNLRTNWSTDKLEHLLCGGCHKPITELVVINAPGTEGIHKIYMYYKYMNIATE